MSLGCQIGYWIMFEMCLDGVWKGSSKNYEIKKSVVKFYLELECGPTQSYLFPCLLDPFKSELSYMFDISRYGWEVPGEDYSGLWQLICCCLYFQSGVFILISLYSDNLGAADKF